MKQIEQFFLEGDSPTLTTHTGKKNNKILPAEWFQGIQRFSNISAWFTGFFKKFTKNELFNYYFKIICKIFPNSHFPETLPRSCFFFSDLSLFSFLIIVMLLEAHQILEKKTLNSRRSEHRKKWSEWQHLFPLCNYFINLLPLLPVWHNFWMAPKGVLGIRMLCVDCIRIKVVMIYDGDV